MANIKVIADNKQVKALNVKLAKDHVDYFVPLYMDEFAGLKGLALDIHVNGDYSKEGLNALTCWKEMKFSDAFDMKNREQYRPDFHHTPAYGWMNDPNGMFYKDGVWNLYFQHNPYGSQWENMTWGHSTSTDLVHWKFQGTPIQPDAVGTIFSGSAVVDKNNTSGFGKDAVVALYTSAAENQTQSMAYSTDNGKTFTKYEGKTDIRAQDIVSVANFAIKSNKQNEDDPRKYVYVVLRKTPGFNSNSFETKESEFIDFIKQYSLEPDNVTVINFKCSDVQINEETGMVNKIIFEKI